MVDLLVLVHAQRYTGFVFSSFSWIIQVYRSLDILLVHVETGTTDL